jgi:hypothetical protein
MDMAEVNYPRSLETMRAFVTAVWSDLVIVSYAVPDAILLPLVPPGLTLDRW